MPKFTNDSWKMVYVFSAESEILIEAISFLTLMLLETKQCTSGERKAEKFDRDKTSKNKTNALMHHELNMITARQEG